MHDINKFQPSPGWPQFPSNELSFAENKYVIIGLSKFFKPGIKNVVDEVIIAVIIANLNLLLSHDMLLFLRIYTPFETKVAQEAPTTPEIKPIIIKLINLKKIFTFKDVVRSTTFIIVSP